MSPFFAYPRVCCRGGAICERLTTKRCPSGSWLARKASRRRTGPSRARRMRPKASGPSGSAPWGGSACASAFLSCEILWRRASSDRFSSQPISCRVWPLSASRAVTRSAGESDVSARSGRLIPVRAGSAGLASAHDRSRLLRRAAVRASKAARLRMTPAIQRRASGAARSVRPDSSAARMACCTRSSASPGRRAVRRARAWRSLNCRCTNMVSR